MYLLSPVPCNLISPAKGWLSVCAATTNRPRAYLISSHRAAVCRECEGAGRTWRQHSGEFTDKVWNHQESQTQRRNQGTTSSRTSRSHNQYEQPSHMDRAQRTNTDVCELITTSCDWRVCPTRLNSDRFPFPPVSGFYSTEINFLKVPFDWSSS